MGVAQGMEGVAGAKCSAAPLVEVAHGIGAEQAAVFVVAEEGIGGLGVLEAGDGLTSLFGFEDFVKFISIRNGSPAVGGFWGFLEFRLSDGDDGAVDGNLSPVKVDVMPGQSAALAEACTGVIGDDARKEKRMAGREPPEDDGKLVGGEGFNFFWRGGVFGDFDVLCGVFGDVLAKVGGIDKGFFEYGADARYGRACKPVLLGIVQELLQCLGPDGAQLAVAKDGADMIIKDGTIGTERIFVGVDADVIGQPFRKKFGDGFFGRLDVAAVDFKGDERTGIGGFGFLARTAAGNFFAFAGFAVADLDGVIPSRAALSDVGHGDSSFPANSQALADLMVIG